MAAFSSVGVGVCVCLLCMKLAQNNVTFGAHKKYMEIRKWREQMGEGRGTGGEVLWGYGWIHVH